MRPLALALLAAATTVAGSAVGATPQPVADFVRHPTYSAVKISPNGDYLAITVDRGEQDVLTVLRTSDLSVLKVNQLPDKKSVGAFHWVSAERLMFTAVRKMGGYAQPFMTGEWFAVDADGSHPRALIFYGTRDATQRSKTVGNERFALVDTLKDDDQYVLMQAMSPRSSEGTGTELVKLDVLTGRRISLGRAPTENCSIVPDEHKAAKFAVCQSSRNEDGDYEDRTELYRRDNGNWVLVSASKTDGKHQSVMRATTNGTIYMTEDDGEAPAAIGTLDTRSGAFKALFQDPVAQVSDFIWSTDQESLIAVVTEAGAEGEHDR